MNILIAGGSGMIGQRLSKVLTKKNHVVSWLSRKKNDNQTSYKQFLWDISSKKIDKECLNGTDVIINLAGEGIADERWTENRKTMILNSRVESVSLLYNLLKDNSNSVKKFISSSAIGFYSDRGDELLNENSSPANDFLGECCQLWENEVMKIAELGISEVRIRTGVVLSNSGGALPKILAPAKLGFGAALGSGKQWMSWIHIDDICGIYIFVCENKEINGAYNAATDSPETNFNFTKKLCEIIRKPFWMPNVPAFALKLAFGEMSIVVLGSTKVSVAKIIQSGYKFQFPMLNTALINLLKK